MTEVTEDGFVRVGDVGKCIILQYLVGCDEIECEVRGNPPRENHRICSFCDEILAGQLLVQPRRFLSFQPLQPLCISVKLEGSINRLFFNIVF